MTRSLLLLALSSGAFLCASQCLGLDQASHEPSLSSITGGETHDSRRCDNESSCNEINTGPLCFQSTSVGFPGCTTTYYCVTNCSENHLERGRCVFNILYDCRDGLFGPCGDGEDGNCAATANFLTNKCDYNGCPGGGASAECAEAQFACYDA